MCGSICDRFDIRPTAFACGGSLYHNLQKALIDGDVRGLHRVQGLVLLRFFAPRYAKTVIFDTCFFKFYLSIERTFL